jgi:hypothetical protein
MQLAKASAATLSKIKASTATLSQQKEKSRGARRLAQKEPSFPCRGRLQQHIRGFRPYPHPARHHQLEKSVDRLLVNCF